MKRETLVQKIIEEINAFDSDELVNLNNWYCDETDCPDDQIYSNDANFFADYFDGNVLEAVRAVSYGDYNYTHDWVKFNGYGNLETMDRIDTDDLVDSVEVMAEEIADNFSAYDHFFNIDPDEDDEDEDDTDEDDDTHLEP